jgi:hydroxyacylglutathione hydrolase
MTLVIEPVPCLKDNYAYLLFVPGSSDAFVVDPSEASPVEDALRARALTLRGVLATHHHLDHVGGIPALVEARGADGAPWVAAHALDAARIPGLSSPVAAGPDAFTAVPDLDFLPGYRLVARHIPGHTRAAIAWGVVPAGASLPTDVFTGDTLFGAGCGRLFEGTPADMFASLGALTSLPDSTRLWFGHEYTSSNLRFAASVEPTNAAVTARAQALDAAPGERRVSTPTTVALEKATNPFVRATSVAELAARRQAKDVF